MILLPLALSAALLSPNTATPHTGGKRIEWSPIYADALERATEERRVVFVALNIDDEGRSERFAKEIYSDKAILALAEETLNVIASTGQHRKKGACKLFAGVECIDHQRTDADLREAGLVARNDEGTICVPQHLWLDPEGELILSVPLEMAAEEMIWCFAFARARLTPDEPVVYPAEARAPRRVLFGESLRPMPGSLGRGLTGEELADELKTLKSAFWSEGRIGTWLKVVLTDDELAVSHIRTELGTGALAWGGVERLNNALDVIGEWSPPAFAPLLTDFVKHRDATVRSHAAVALEQMGSAETLKVVRGALSREKDAAVKKRWLRALGACGFADKGARKTLLKAARSEKTAELQRNAMVALGWAGSDEDVIELLTMKLASEEEDEVVAALCATAFSRDSHWIPAVERVAKEAPEGPIRSAGEAALAVLRGAGLVRIESHVGRVCGDELPRGRIFFKSR